MIKEEMTKSLPISKMMVWKSYLQVKSKGGGRGIDGETIERFDQNMSKNLYKLWNRLSSGSYFPPAVRTVLIPKKSGGTRPLGIPTVSDRIAQGVVKDYLEPVLDPKFSEYSYGYRPNKSAHQAVESCQANCREYAWVLDIDIKGFFDNMSHDLLLAMLSGHTQEKWVLMYVERWLKAGVEQEDGSIKGRTKGTPQGGVISPLLSNLYLHHAFDEWIQQNYPYMRYERYADDIVIHCHTEEQAKTLQEALKARLEKYALELHPEKTKIVYCKDYRRGGKSEHRSFTFLGFSFQPKILKSKEGGKFLAFRGVVSQTAKTHMREMVKEKLNPRNMYTELEDIAKAINSRVRGWMNYYGKVEYWGMNETIEYIKQRLLKWIQNKYRIVGKHKAVKKLTILQTQNPTLFVHWQYGIKR